MASQAERLSASRYNLFFAILIRAKPSSASIVREMAASGFCVEHTWPWTDVNVILQVTMGRLASTDSRSRQTLEGGEAGAKECDVVNSH